MNDSPPGIPPELHSEYEGRPFHTCTRCGEMLREIPEGYQIFKLYRKGETIYEYVLCHPCHSGLVDRFSQESRTRLADFYRQRVSMHLGRGKCAVCGDTRSEAGAEEFSLTAACKGDQLVHDLMVCGPCRVEMQSLLSRETRGVWDRFVEDNLPGAPSGAISPYDLVPA